MEDEGKKNLMKKFDEERKYSRDPDASSRLLQRETNLAWSFALGLDALF